MPTVIGKEMPVGQGVPLLPIDRQETKNPHPRYDANEGLRISVEQ